MEYLGFFILIIAIQFGLFETVVSNFIIPFMIYISPFEMLRLFFG